MAGELDTSSVLAPQPQQALQGAPSVGSSAFQQADAFTLKHEGGATRNDGIGHTANQGIDQNAHPGVDVLAMTPQQTQAMRHQYWTAVNGDALAQHDPRLALVAYETAIASGPSVANHLLQQSGGDVGQLMKLRVNFMNGLVQRDPEKYGPVAQGWANRNRDLAAAAGLDPKSFGLSPGGAPQTMMAAAQPTASTSQTPPATASPEQKEDTPSAAATPESAKPVVTAQLSPMQAQAAPAMSTRDLYLDLLKRRQGLNA